MLERGTKETAGLRPSEKQREERRFPSAQILGTVRARKSERRILMSSPHDAHLKSASSLRADHTHHADARESGDVKGDFKKNELKKSNGGKVEDIWQAEIAL